eukprot:359366-Chlamydomonas_euryale.AAC.4
MGPICCFGRAGGASGIPSSHCETSPNAFYPHFLPRNVQRRPASRCDIPHTLRCDTSAAAAATQHARKHTRMGHE